MPDLSAPNVDALAGAEKGTRSRGLAKFEQLVLFTLNWRFHTRRRSRQHPTNKALRDEAREARTLALEALRKLSAAEHKMRVTL